MHAVVRTCAAMDASKNRKPDNNPITALFASHFQDALSQANLLWLFDLHPAGLEPATL